MANVAVRKIEDKPALVPVVEGIRKTFDRIRERAFELFERRGAAPGFELEDWVQAEHDLFWVPQSEIAEADSYFNIRVGVPGFEGKDLDVTAQTNELLIQGKTEIREEKTEGGVTYSEFGSKSLFRRFILDTPIEVDGVVAKVDNGMLTIVAPKKTDTVKKTAAVA
jgi:HSP20 family protein